MERVVFEPTGPYHRAFEARSGRPASRSSRSIPVRRAASPRRLASSRRPIAWMRRCWLAWARLLELEARPARSKALLELKELYIAREALVKDRTAAKNRRQDPDAIPLEEAECTAPRTNRSADSGDRNRYPRRHRSQRRPVQPFRNPDHHPGRLGRHRLRLADRNAGLGALDAGQAASLAGLAPIARQSGRWTGRSFIRGGRADVRQALYMPALVAARFNPDMKAKYTHLIEHRKTRTLAAEGALVFAEACKLGLEGIVSKRAGSRYRSGTSRNWLKTKNGAFARE